MKWDVLLELINMHWRNRKGNVLIQSPPGLVKDSSWLFFVLNHINFWVIIDLHQSSHTFQHLTLFSFNHHNILKSVSVWTENENLRRWQFFCIDVIMSCLCQQVLCEIDRLFQMVIIISTNAAAVSFSLTRLQVSFIQWSHCAKFFFVSGVT